jgi:transposase-like protein
MPSNNSKYTQEMRDKTARYVLETEKSATSVAEELGINTNTVCKWVREYRRNHELPSYAEEKGIVKKRTTDGGRNDGPNQGTGERTQEERKRTVR